MSFTSGKTSPDVKISKTLGGLAYTNILAVTANFNATSLTYDLATTLTPLKALPHGQLTTASKVKVASTSDSDTINGTGARIVQIAGLVDYQFFEENIFMDGKTEVESINDFDKILDMSPVVFGSNVNADTGDSNSVGDIYVGTGEFTDGVPANPILGIDVSNNDPSTRVGVFTIPDGKFGFIRDIFASTEPDKKENSAVALTIAFKIFGFPETVWFKGYEIFFDGAYQYIPEFVFPIPPKTDIQVRAKKITAKDKVGDMFMTIELQDIRG